jgi:BMFP domain-containing protein YqiC
MLDTKTFDRLVESVIAALPRVPQDLEQNLRVALQGVFDRLELVTREELEVQEQVLARTRARLAELERKIAELETRLAKKQGG